MGGYGKISNSVEQHIADGHIQAGASIMPIRILGLLEWLGCTGIILPWLLQVFPVLTPLSALGFSMIMCAGIFVHLRKKEYKMLPLLLLLLAMSITVAWFRFKQLH